MDVIVRTTTFEVCKACSSKLSKEESRRSSRDGVWSSDRAFSYRLAPVSPCLRGEARVSFMNNGQHCTGPTSKEPIIWRHDRPFDICSIVPQDWSPLSGQPGAHAKLSVEAQQR